MTSWQSHSPLQDGSTRRSQLEGNTGVDSPAITYWGAALEANTKDTTHCRIGFVNIHGLGLSASNYKNTEFYSYVNKYNFDIFGMAETNVNWSAVSVGDRLHERSRSWWKVRHVSYSYLSHDRAMRHQRHQYGGTAVWTRNSMVHRVADSGKDPFGRWAWTRYRGLANRWLKVVASYRPCLSTEPNSVFQQQLRNFPPSKPEPRQSFLDDLKQQIQL